MSRYEQPERWIGEGIEKASENISTAILIAALVMSVAMTFNGC